MKNPKTYAIVFAVAFAAGLAGADNREAGILGIGVNHLGWEPSAAKTCWVRNPPSKTFAVETIGTSADGEYDMPPAALFHWALARLTH